LLAALLLDLTAGRGMSILEYDSDRTSNDLPESRVAENNSAALNDSVGVHSAEGLPNIADLPAVSTKS
jgi:hypothetical protein